MPKIPRTERSVGFQPAMMPGSSGDGYAAPGKGMVQIGQGIAAMGGAISSLQGVVDKDDEFNTKLGLLELSNAQDLEDRQRQSTFNPDTDDVDGYSNERIAAFRSRADSVLANARSPRAQQIARMGITRMQGTVGERAYGFQAQAKQQKLYFGTERAITTEFDRLNEPLPEITGPTPVAANPTPAEGARDPELVGPTAEEGANVPAPEMSAEEQRSRIRAQRFESTLRSAEAIIADMPGSPETKQRLAKHAASLAMTAFSKQPDAYPQVEAWLERQRGQGYGVGGSGERPTGVSGPVGPVSIERSPIPLPPNAGRQRSGGIKGFIVHETMGSDNLDGNLSWAKKSGTGANYYIDKSGKVFQVAPDTFGAFHAGKGRSVRPDLNNDNTLSVEIMTRKGERPNEAQVAAAQALVIAKSKEHGFDIKNVYGHGEVAPGHKMAIEGMDVVKRIRGGTAVASATEPDPKVASGPAPVSQRGLVQFAGLKPAGTQNDASSIATSSTGSGIKGQVTAYSPQAGGSKMEGGYAAARPGPDGKAVVRDWDDLDAGRSNYITLAGNPEFYGREYIIPRITVNGKTRENVLAVVHDTGSAFKNAPEGRFDIPIGKDRSDKEMASNAGAWKNEGVEFIPKPKGGTQVAQAGNDNARSTNTIPQVAGSATGAITSPLRAELTEIMMKAAPVMREQFRKQTEGMVAQIEAHAAKGYEIDDPTLARTAAMVAKTGDASLVQRMDLLSGIVRNARATNAANPAELTAVIQSMEAKAARGPITAQEAAALEFFKKKRTETAAQLDKTPYEWGARTGVLPSPPPPINPDSPPQQLGADLARRVADRAALIQRSGQDVPFFQPAEVAALTDYLYKSDIPSEVRLGSLRVMYDALGPDMPKAMKEISKDAPEIAMLGWLVANNGDPAFMKDAVRGLDLIRSDKANNRLPDDALLLSKTDAVTGVGSGAFEMLPEARNYAVSVAKLAYQARAERKGLDPKGTNKSFDDDLWKQSLQEAMGQNKSGDGKVYGGVGSMSRGIFSSYQVRVPTNVRQDGGLAEIQRNLRWSDFVPMSPAKAAAAAAGREEPGPEKRIEHPSTVEKPANAGPRWQPPPGEVEKRQEGGVQSLGTPVTASGQQVTMGAIRSARLVAIGGNNYLMQTGQSATGEPEFIKVRTINPRTGQLEIVNNFVLNTDRVRPFVEKRVQPGTYRQ